MQRHLQVKSVMAFCLAVFMLLGVASTASAVSYTQRYFDGYVDAFEKRYSGNYSSKGGQVSKTPFIRGQTCGYAYVYDDGYPEPYQRQCRKGDGWTVNQEYSELWGFNRCQVWSRDSRIEIKDASMWCYKGT